MLVDSCPGSEVLHGLLQGDLPSYQVEEVARHLEDCPRCAETVHVMKPTDTMVKLMNGVKPLPFDSSEAAIVEGLVQTLTGLPAQVSGAVAPTQSMDGEWGPWLAPPQQPGEIGRLGAYAILAQLGAGGMGVVYLAEDPHLKRKVAIKAMKPSLVKGTDFRERFLREAQATAAVKHDNVVTIHHVGEAGDVPFLVMEFLEGTPLDRRLAGGQKLPLGEVLRIGRQVAEGLAAAHDHGLIHRDIKPSNLWLEGAQQRVKILDFGLARPVAAETRLTHSGMVIGSPAYMSPEQAEGQTIDPRTDLFSLGCVLYEMCTGHKPFQGKTALAILSAVVRDTPVSITELNPDVPAELAALVNDLLAKNPAQRPESARAVVERLRAIEKETSATELLPKLAPASPPGPQTAARRGKPRWRWPIAVAAGLLLLLGGGLLLPQIIIRIRDPKTGKEKVITAPEDSVVTVERPGDKKKVLVVDQAQAARQSALVFGKLDPAKIPGEERQAAGNGDAKKTPAGLVAVYGDSRFSHWWQVNDVGFSPDGKHVASAGHDKTVRVWDLKTGREGRILQHDAVVSNLAYSPDGNLLATSSMKGGQIWDTQTWKTVGALLEYGQPLAFSPNSKRIVTVHGDMAVFDARTSKRLLVLKGHKTTERIYDIRYSPDGKLIASCGNDLTARVWDAETGKEVVTFSGHTNAVLNLAFSPDSQHVATLSSDRTIKIWEARTGKELQSIPKNVGTPHGLDFSPDGAWLVFGSFIPAKTDTTYGVKALNLKSGKVEKTFQTRGAVSSLRFSADGKHLAAGTLAHTVEVWEFASGKRLSPDGHRGILTDVDVHPDGTLLLATGGSATLWDTVKGSVAAQLPVETYCLAGSGRAGDAPPNPWGRLKILEKVTLTNP